jgi:citrate synthase
VDHFKLYPKNSNPMDMLKAAAALLALHDPEKDDDSHDANIRKAIRLVAKFPAMIAWSYRLSRGQDIIQPDNSLAHGENFLYMLLGKKPDPYVAHVFDISLICYADHGFNASTFASRVTVSTMSDIYSGTTSAIGTLKGSLHGGANEEAMYMLMEIGTPENAEHWVMDALATKKKIMGFGHREYKTGDPRAAILTGMAGEVSEKLGDSKWYRIATIVEDLMRREKNIVPNVDFPTSYVYYLMGLPIEIYTPIFALSRIAGWTAHMIEQLDNNRLIRPKAIYEGPQHLDYVPRAQR